MTIAEKLTTIAENQQKVYDVGFEKGKQAEYDRFWDAFQADGNRTDYYAAFTFWDDETFKPKYDIIPTGSASTMFSRTRMTNLPALIENAGIVFDVSNSNNLGYFFNESSTLVEAPLIDATKATSVDRIFNGCTSLKKASVIFPENKLTSYTNAFARCYELEDFTAGGVIDIPLSFVNSSKLTAVSVQSIIDHLKDLTGQTAQTLTFHATVGGNVTQEQKDAVSAKNWTLVY